MSRKSRWVCFQHRKFFSRLTGMMIGPYELDLCRRSVYGALLLRSTHADGNYRWKEDGFFGPRYRKQCESVLLKKKDVFPCEFVDYKGRDTRSTSYFSRNADTSCPSNRPRLCTSSESKPASSAGGFPGCVGPGRYLVSEDSTGVVVIILFSNTNILSA